MHDAFGGAQDNPATYLRVVFRVVGTPSQPLGAGQARNVGVASGTGEVLLFCDDDDTWTPRHVVAVMRAFQRDPYLG